MRKKKRILRIAFVLMFTQAIPVYATTEGSIGTSIKQLFFYLSIFAIVMLIALYGTRLIAKNFKGISRSKYMNLLDTINIPGGKLSMIKVVNRVYIILITSTGSTLIDILKEEIIIEEELLNHMDDEKYNRDSIKKMLSKFNMKNDKEDRNDEKKN